MRHDPADIRAMYPHLEPRQMRGTADGIRYYANRPGLWSMAAEAKRLDQLALADAWDAASRLPAPRPACTCDSFFDGNAAARCPVHP